MNLSRAAKPGSAHAFPIRLVMLATALALALIASPGWYVWSSVRVLRQTEIRTFRLLELTGELRDLDESTWASARLLASSGEDRWLQRYRDAVTRREAVLSEFRTIAPEFYGGLAFGELRASSEKPQGTEAAALALAASDAEQQRRQDSTRQIAHEIIQRAGLALDSQREHGRLVMAAVALAVSLLLFTWVISLRISSSLIAKHRREETERAEQARVAAFVADVREALTKSDTLGATLEDCAAAMARNLDQAVARIWTLDPEENVLILRASAGLFKDTGGPQARVPMDSRDRIARIARERQPQLTNDVRSNPDFADMDWARIHGIAAFAGYPLIVEDRVAGVMAMFSRAPIAQAIIAGLASVADGVAHSIERDRAESLMKSYAQELALARDAAIESARLQSQFIANMSHEIRTPMNGVIGMTQLALETDLTEEQREYLEVIRSSTVSLLTLINDIMDYSKIEAGRVVLDRIDFSMRDLVYHSIRALERSASEKGLKLDCQIDPEAPDLLVGDPARLRQILVNLAGNAVKFTDHGEITVKVDVDSLADGEAAFRISVSDTGIGIPKEQREIIFQPFTQADGSSTRKYGGTGLGLAICRQLVKLGGGKIWVEGEPGSGSTFAFTARYELCKLPQLQ